MVSPAHSHRNNHTHHPENPENLLKHRNISEEPQWTSIPAWQDLESTVFNNPRWQMRNSVMNPEQIQDLLADQVDHGFIEDLLDGYRRAPMVMRLTPYVLSLIDWRSPYTDPIRRQFLPLGSEWEPDHPMCTLDALAEQKDSKAPGLTHRYPDKVLLLSLDVCPVYCRYCTRSYSIGSDAEGVEKINFKPHRERLQQAFEYIRFTPTVEDVVVSGGDVSMLPGNQLKIIGEELLSIPHVRRIRFATKALAVVPQKISGDEAWLDALTSVAERGRRQGVHVCVHTHFNHPEEITYVTKQACDTLFQRAITVRNQSVLLAGVNDNIETMTTLVQKLSYINVQPYYVYIHDLVPGVECLRTSLADAVELEKNLRGSTAGFMTPTFVCDAPGGGGKRDLHSFELYNEDKGIAIYRSPVVDPNRAYYYFDPLRSVEPAVRMAWQSPTERQNIIDNTLRRAGMNVEEAK